MTIIAGGDGELALIDFTNCEIDLTANYGGSDKKRGVIYQGRRYMLKLSDRIPEKKQNSLNSSYLTYRILYWGRFVLFLRRGRSRFILWLPVRILFRMIRIW